MDDNGYTRPPVPGEGDSPTVLFGAETEETLETHYLVIPDEVWRPETEEETPSNEGQEPYDHAQETPEPHHEPAGRATAGSVGGVVAALVAGVLPSLVVGPPAALVAGIVTGVIGGLVGHAVGVAVHDRRHAAA